MTTDQLVPAAPVAPLPSIEADSADAAASDLRFSSVLFSRSETAGRVARAAAGPRVEAAAAVGAGTFTGGVLRPQACPLMPTINSTPHSGIRRRERTITGVQRVVQRFADGIVAHLRRYPSCAR